MSKTFEAGENILLIDHKGREFMFHLTPGKQWHSHHGYLTHDDLIGLEEGSTVYTSMRHRLHIIRPTLAQIVLNMPRQAQVIYPKDLGAILINADVYPGATVVEIGTGYGALTMALIRAVGENGRVISYEIRDDHFKAAQRTVERFLGPCPQWTIRLGDATEGLEESGVDRVIVDVQEPWKMIPPVSEALRPEGSCFPLRPTPFR